MPTNDEQARKAKAQKIREETDAVVARNAKVSEGKPDEAKPGDAISPREFTERRMRELQQKKDGGP